MISLIGSRSRRASIQHPQVSVRRRSKAKSFRQHVNLPRKPPDFFDADDVHRRSTRQIKDASRRESVQMVRALFRERSADRARANPLAHLRDDLGKLSDDGGVALDDVQRNALRRTGAEPGSLFSAPISCRTGSGKAWPRGEDAERGEGETGR